MSACCFTGHRTVAREDVPGLVRAIDRHITALLERGVFEFRAGGALGFDTLAALRVLTLQERDPRCRLVLYLPCRDQTRGWSEAACRVYRYILERADAVFYTADQYVKGCMLERDRRLVEGSDVCLAYCTRNAGGSFYTCTYALKKNLQLINLADLLGSGEV